MKKLIAAAVASAFITPATFAAESNVTLYGSLRVFGNYVHAGDGYKNAFNVSDGSSRIGFKGTDKITDDLSIIWQVESSVEVNGGQGVWSNRNSFVGLQGVLGTFRFGNFDTAYTRMDNSGPQAELFDNYGSSVDPKATNGFYGRANTRLKNSINYETPNLAGLVGRLSYGVDNKAQTQNNSWIGSASVTYSINGLNIGAAYQHAKNHSLLTNKFYFDNGAVGIISGPVRRFTDAQQVNSFEIKDATYGPALKINENIFKSDALKVAVNYQFDTGFNIGLGWERLEDKSFLGNGKQDTYFVGANLPVGQWLLQAGYGYANKLRLSNVHPDYKLAGKEGKAQMALLGSQYALSKRSRIFSYVSWVDNKDSTAFSAGNDIYGYNNKETISTSSGSKKAYAVSLGFRTDF